MSQLYEVGTIIISLSQMRKLRHRSLELIPMLTQLVYGWVGIYNQAEGNAEAVLVTEIYLDQLLEGYNEGVLLLFMQRMASFVLGCLVSTNSASH